MSGLVGWIDFRRDLVKEDETFDTMTDTMSRRGPDSRGTWLSRHVAFGHRGSLASDCNHTTQPVLVKTKNAPVILIYCGRIFNSRELAGEIKELNGDVPAASEAEILIQSFLLWGNEFVSRLDGMFAFAIWDGRRKQLLLGRDRLGMKHLYYFKYNDGIIFSSEPKGIIANPLFEARLDFSAISILLQPRLALPGETPLVGLQAVPPAHVISYSQSNFSLKKYWGLVSMSHEHTFEQSAKHVRILMEDIVGRQVPPDGSCGTMLSGGLDSSSVAALAMQRLRKEKSGRMLDTFCVQFETDKDHFVPTERFPDRDAPYAVKVANFIGSRHETLDITVQDLLDALPETRRAWDLPGFGQFDASMYLLFREMRRKCMVGLTGEVSDEIFGGHQYFFNPELIRRDQFPWLPNFFRLSDLLSPELAARIDPLEDERARYSQLISEVPRLPGEDPENARIREIFYLGLFGLLATLLDRLDRMTTAVGLEMRLPFCDHRLVEYVWNVPWSMKSRGGEKGLLKSAMADILPGSTLERKKSAYPHVQSPSFDQALLSEVTLAINDRHSPIAGIFDMHRMNNLLGKLKEGNSGVNAMHALIPAIEINRWIEDYNISFR